MPSTTQPIAFVSDESFLALPGVHIEFQQTGKCVAVTQSTATGGIYADLPAGNYRVILAKDGYTGKRVDLSLDPDSPAHFRLLSSKMYGYAWPKWVKAGESGQFRVHCPEPYHLSLWRYGQTKELIQSIGVFDEHGPQSNTQVLPDGDFTKTGVRWNQTGYSPTAQRIVAPSKSGLYFFHAETPSGKFLSFPWIVAPSKPQARIAVIASTNTWNAYNNFGGRSNYINPTELPSEPTVNARQDLSRYRPGKLTWSEPKDAFAPLSFDRPEHFNHIDKDVQLCDPIRGRQGCHLAEAEWKLLGWLERERFQYDLYSDHQLHDGTLNLDAYQVLILSTHPEYWSRDAYFRVKQWVFDRAGKLMYLGGNGIDCEIEYLSSGETVGPVRTHRDQISPNAAPVSMLCKTSMPTVPGILFPDPTTGQNRECRFHQTVESPAHLLGVVFTDPGAMTGAPYQVVDASHWIFSGTGLKNGDLFGSASLHQRCPGGASGHETDKRSASSPANTAVLARGTNPDNGGAEITLHEIPSGGAVFSASSITWPASILVDPAVSKITRNVLDRFTK